MEDKTRCLARATCSTKCIIRADWSLVGGLKAWLPPMQAKAFQVATGDTPVAQMSFVSQVLWPKEKGGLNGRTNTGAAPVAVQLSGQRRPLHLTGRAGLDSGVFDPELRPKGGLRVSLRSARATRRELADTSHGRGQSNSSSQAVSAKKGTRPCV